MAKHRVLYEFASTPGEADTSGSDAGWTESWYDPTDSTNDAANLKALNFMRARLLLLDAGWRITAIRISVLDAGNNPLRKGILTKVTAANGRGAYDVQAGIDAEQPWDAINLAIQTVGGSRRAFLMRGLAQGVLGGGGSYLAPPRFVTQAANFARNIAGMGEGVDAVTTALALRTRGVTALTAISGVEVVAPAGVNLVASVQRPLIRVPITTVQAGNTVQISDVQNVMGINGQWVATQLQVDPTNNQFAFVLLAPRRRNTVNGTNPVGGSARYWNWALDNITGLTVGDGASRRTGRPPQQRRGRRSARRS